MKLPPVKQSKRPLPAKKSATTKADAALSFASLVDAIRHVHEESAAAVNRTVNTTLTLRNWVIGAYIHHYELNGSDRARYGAGLIEKLAEALERKKVTACEPSRLYSYIAFFRTYPQIGRTLRAGLPEHGFVLDQSALPILRSATGELDGAPKKEIFRSLTGKSQSGPKVRSLTEQSGGAAKVRTVTAQSAEEAISDASGLWLAEIQKSAISKFATDGRLLIERLSFTHLEQLITIEEPLKRAFYEIECIRGNWSVRDLKRQIGSLYFERAGLSKDKEKLSRMVNEGVECAEPKLAIRDPYIFEFLGLRAKDAVVESDLEAALIEHLREFLLELGHGFCLETQQKSIVIGKTRGYVDLVFYHRILKCHVLVDLKIEPFTHEHLGQLNTYVTWYCEHMMAPGDNPPIGLLLCTDKDHALVRYATASVDNMLFVSKCAVELPTKEELEEFLHKKHLELTVKDGAK